MIFTFRCEIHIVQDESLLMYMKLTTEISELYLLFLKRKCDYLTHVTSYLFIESLL